MDAVAPGEHSALLRLPSEEGGAGDSSTSESEYHHALELVLDTEDHHRRRSSLVGTDPGQLLRRRTLQRQQTACRVHQILEAERRARRRQALSAAGVPPLPSLGVAEDEDEDDEGRAEAKMARKALSNGFGADVDSEGVVRSRLLTKKQLSEMAYGVRQLSKRLGSLRLRLNVRTILLLTKIHDDELVLKSRQLAEWLLSKEREAPYIVYIEDKFEDDPTFDVKSLLDKDPSYRSRLKYWTTELCQKRPHTFDFVVSLGGDGTVLYASWLFQRIVPPVLSFSLGSLGFLTKFDFDDYQQSLTTAFRDGVTVSLRLRFEGTVMRSRTRDRTPRPDLVEELIGEEADDDHTHQPYKSIEILNDIVVDRGPNATMSALELFGDQQHFTTLQADGICVATPTGSTAYNLSTGGSLSHPDNPVILVTAICAHTLSFRPIILPDTIVLRVGVPYDARTSSWASFDGRERIELMPGDYITISASRFPFASVTPPGALGEDWMNSISRTLQWNSRSRQKAFQQTRGESKKTAGGTAADEKAETAGEK